jgi:alkylhydroperoxidase/carboxymuconolactone decarboxylase family protein YurZ
MDYTDRLRRLAISDSELADDLGRGVQTTELDAKSLALVRLAALVAVGGAQPSYGALADDAVDAGASADEIVDVVFGVATVVGLPSVVAAAPNMAMALGYDLDDAMNR